MSPRLLAGLLLFAACSTNQHGGLTPDGGPDASSDAGCFVSGYAQPAFTCALPEPCEQVVYSDPSEVSPAPPNPSPPTITLAAAQCVLQHIRDDVPSYLTVHDALFEGFRDEFIWVQGDGSAILRRHYRNLSTRMRQRWFEFSEPPRRPTTSAWVG